MTHLHRITLPVRMYNWKGDQLKEDIDLPYAEALTLADEDIDDKWEIYKFEFLKGYYP